MQQFRESDGQQTMYDDLVYTLAMLLASGVHAALATPLEIHVASWEQLDADRRAAETAVVRANARVAWRDMALDGATTRFATRLLADCEGDRSHKTFVAFFPAAPSDVTRMALGRQLDTMKDFAKLAETHTLSKTARTRLQAVLDAMEQGSAALADRSAAEQNVTAVSERQHAWRDEANARRRVVDAALGAHAAAEGLPRDYAEGFFPTRAEKKPRAAKAPEATKTTTTATSAGLTTHEQVLALPDALLRGLAEDFIATLPANVQSIVRARRTG